MANISNTLTYHEIISRFGGVNSGSLAVRHDKLRDAAMGIRLALGVSTVLWAGILTMLVRVG